ncbi:concanavalin A-like lectin/glucanase domain-containing protein [Trichoderma austrokoningii]
MRLSISIALTAAIVAWAAPAPMPTPPGIPSDAGARTALASLKVAVPGSGSDYDRTLFPHWITISGTCDAREYVLKRDGEGVVVNSACVPQSGDWISPYDNAKFTNASKLDIDHMVPLKNAWISGASKWTTPQRQAFANDVTIPQLWAVSASSNRSKGDKSPDKWKPPLSSFYCTYAKSWIEVKSTYALTISSAEKTALSTSTINLNMLRRLILTLLFTHLALASLKDLSHCDPLKKDAHCPPDPAFASKITFDFTKSTWGDQFTSFWAVDASTSQDKRQLVLNNTDGKGAAFTIWQDGQAPTLTSSKYMLFGKVSVQVQAAQGPGLITAIVLKSDSGDEIDWVSELLQIPFTVGRTHCQCVNKKELLGAFENQAQTNYFFDGEPLFNTYNTTYRLDTSSFSALHTYGIDWTPTYINFSIDNVVRKSWRLGDNAIPAYKWPQTPMQIKLGIWSVSGGNGSDPGTVVWAGGLPDWSGRDADRNPYKAFFKTLKLEDYSGGCNETQKGAEIEYLYNERTNGWQNIQVKGCVKRSTTPGAYPPPLPSSSIGSQPSQTSSHSSASGTPSQSGEQHPSESGSNGDDSDSAALPGGRPSSPLGAVIFLLWLLTI